MNLALAHEHLTRAGVTARQMGVTKHQFDTAFDVAVGSIAPHDDDAACLGTLDVYSVVVLATSFREFARETGITDLEALTAEYDLWRREVGTYDTLPEHQYHA